MKNTNNICVFDIKNSQNEYAYALEFIECCENCNNTVDTIVKLGSITDKIGIRGGVVDKGTAVRYYEMPIEKRNIDSEAGYVYKNGIYKLMELKRSSINERGISFFTNHEMIYHIRIHFDDKNNLELVNLQYLALLLQRLEYLFIGMSDVKKRLSVFIVPKAGKPCPYVSVENRTDMVAENNLYNKSSHYLRLLSKEYAGIIYSARKKGSKIQIIPIDYSISARTDEFFPIVIIDKDNYKKLFEKSISKDTLRELFELKDKRRFKNAAADNPQIALCDYIAETALYRMQKNLDFDKDALAHVYEMIIKKNTINWIVFSIFSFIYAPNEKNNDSCEMEYIWENAMNLCMGIKQLVQNSIQYSEKCTCIFSFVLNDNNSLKITVTDLNYKQSMIDSFVENLNWEYENINDSNRLSGHKLLIEEKEKIALRNFFSEFNEDDIFEVWKIFRQQDISAHIGLLLFLIAVNRCNATVSVRSSIRYEQNDGKANFYKSFNNQEKSVQQYQNHAIPGCQFSIIIPLGELQKLKVTGLGQVNIAGKLEENYLSFAKCVEYKSEKICCVEKCNETISHLINNQSVTDSKNKFLLVQRWREIWEAMFAQSRKGKDICYIDIDELEANPYFADGDNVEVFIKGFLELASKLVEYRINALAFVGASRLFIETFRDACIAFAPRNFPKDIQLYVCEKNCVDNLLLFGNNYFEAMENSYLMSIEHGSRLMGTKEYVTARGLCEKMGNITEKARNEKVEIIPFDVILPYKRGDTKNTIFDKRLQELANNDIDGENAGFLIRNTHMRLGSKVHIHSFYEMPFLFYRTSIANRISLQILRDIYARKNIDIKHDKVMFYGYASYSRAILSSITEILKYYRKLKNVEDTGVSFAAYQHNLQSASEEIQMHYGFMDDFPAKLCEDKIKTNELIKVVQIVPISSTLTTFEKMWSRFGKAVEKECEDNLQLSANYTVFWITNILNENPNKPTEIERKYWSEVILEEQLIKTNFTELMSKNINLIRYFIRCPVEWEHPLECKWCYPKQAIDEMPLVETDQTSTVPAQQIRKRKRVRGESISNSEIEERMIKLKGCISYGHIIREHNHFQYYIDTQAYFYKVRMEVQAWLEACRDNDKNDNNIPIMYVIFTPEHNTNVGFAQYVNTYYFGGMAEIVSFNEDKEYRSNFVCEHAALIETIADLYKYIEVNSWDEMPIKFYYVDDTIISGETFQKANSFLRSLLPEKYRNSYGTNIISKCFLLIDRLSDETKRNYVRDIDKDFNSFLHIDISNMRTQGDSCVGCKLQQDAVRLFKRSTTRNIEKYWANKIKRYTPVPYDKMDELKEFQNEDAYKKLIISHIAHNVLFVDNDSYEIGKVFDSILTYAFKFISKKKGVKGIVFKYDNIMQEIEGVDGLGKFLKIIARPFFSFDFKIKMQVLTLDIILAELLLGNEENVSKYEYDPENTHVLKQFIIQDNRVSKAIELWYALSKNMTAKDKLSFLQNVLLECMTDLKSTYLLRKGTLKLVYEFMKGYSFTEQKIFWELYIQNIHRIIDCSSDEMRSFNFEYLLLSGEEYQNFKEKYKNRDTYAPRFLYKEISGRETPEEEDPFYIFCHEILLQNTRILFDGVEKDIYREQSSDTYYMEQWRGFHNLERFAWHKEDDNEMPLEEEKRLFEFLKKMGIGGTVNLQTPVKERYENLLNVILNMVVAKYSIKKENIKIALLTWTQEHEKYNEKAVIEHLDILTDVNVACPEDRFYVKEEVVHALNSEERKAFFSLNENGYLIDDKKLYFILFFDNPEVELKVDIKRTLKPLAKVYMFMEIGATDKMSFYYIRFILRDILVYRNRIMRMLETDFAGDMFTKYAHTIGEKNIIAHEKAISHNNTLDNESVLGFLVKQNTLNKYDNLDSYQAIKWLLMRNYVNEQIAKLFNRSFHDEKGLVQPRVPESPILYIDKNAEKYNKVSFFNNKLNTFLDLNLISDDRFSLLESIITINYNGLKNIHFIEDREQRGYNVEFMRCVLIDIIFSAINHEVNRHEFLLRIDFLLNCKKVFRNDGLLPDSPMIKRLRNNDYLIEFSVERTEDEAFDYLMIKNPVYKSLNDWKYKNEVIRKRMEDPLDYPDGHLSLLTIKRYIEGLREDIVGKTEFKYFKGPNGQLWFESKLPIVRKELE